MEDFLGKRRELLTGSKPGLEAARRLCEITDTQVRMLSQGAAGLLGDRWAIVALGGWGAGTMLPASDLDILVLSDATPDRLKPFVEAVLYPLWDAGLKVGHQVRSPKQQLKAMREDFATCTAALTARPLAGDVTWAQAAIDGWAQDAFKRRKALVKELLGRPRPGTPYLLEPDLKYGAGGRRDYDEMRWAACVLSGKPLAGLDELVSVAAISEQDRQAAERSAEVIVRARWENQLDGFGDKLPLDAAEELESVTPGEVQLALAETARCLTNMRSALARKPQSSSHLTAAEIFALLAKGELALDALEWAAQSGLLDELLPGYRELMTCRRPGLGHELTVGAHSLKAAAIATDVSGDGVLSGSLSSITDMRLLLVAALAHDMGKAVPGPEHARRGVVPASEAARGFGLDGAAVATVGRLVEHHLLLSETALHEDLDDEDVLLHCASLVGDRETLALLHLLTAADARATGPSTWTPWTRVLVDTLVSRLEAALDEDVAGAGLAMAGEESRKQAIALMAEDDPSLREFVERAPLRYLAGRLPAQIRSHALLVRQLGQMTRPGAALLEVSAGPGPEMRSVTIVTRDHPDLLARLSGAIALAGLDILALDAFAAPGKDVLDTFVVKSATARPLTTESFAKLERLIEAALLDRLELETRLAERRRHYKARASGDVEVELHPAGWFTRLHVTCPDRPGLLYDVARSVSASGLDITWAKVQTVEGIAKDVFHLVDAKGTSVTDAGVLGHVAMRIRESL